MTRNVRKSVIQRFCRSASSTAMSTGYPGVPVKPGNGFATSDEGAHVRHVTNVRGEEAVQRIGRAAAHEGDQAVRDRGEERRERPERQPDEVRQGEEEPEQHRQPRATAVVLEHEPHRCGPRLQGWPVALGSAFG